MRTVRFLLMVSVGVLLSIAALSEAWNAFQTGIVTIPLGKHRWGLAITFVRNESVLGYPVGVALFTLVGAVAAALSLWALHTLVRGHPAQRAAMVQHAIAHVERAAPSGLKPLWVGLLVAAVCALVYAAAA